MTERIKLATTILIAPYRRNGALLAKQAASRRSRCRTGRLVLGVAVGGREDDYEASGADIHTRGRRLRRDARASGSEIWAGESFGMPARSARAPGRRVIIGGAADAAFERAAKYGDGWIMGGGTPDSCATGAAKLAGRLGGRRPRGRAAA